MMIIDVMQRPNRAQANENQSGENLIQFCIDHNFTITGTLFQNHVRRLHMRLSHDKQYKNQIDCILVNNRWRSSIKNVNNSQEKDVTISTSTRRICKRQLMAKRESNMPTSLCFLDYSKTLDCVCWSKFSDVLTEIDTP